MSMKNKVYQKLAYWCPAKLRYFIVIDAWAKATTGEYSSTDATSITVAEVIERNEP